MAVCQVGTRRAPLLGTNGKQDSEIQSRGCTEGRQQSELGILQHTRYKRDIS